MTDDERERVLADCLAAYHLRRACGQDVRLESFRVLAGDAWDDLRDVLAAEAAFDEVIEPRSGAMYPRAFGEFTLLSELGRGAFGCVHRAVHGPLGREVAIKVLRAGSGNDDVARERFRREVRACALVRHPHIVEILDCGTFEDHPWYSMTLLRGCTLDAAARSGRLPPAREIARAAAAIADALQRVHDAGVVHRDIKPSNIFVDGDDPADGLRSRWVLTDFGLARTAAPERLTATGQSIGTPLYMSPEQVIGDGSNLDGRADVYGLGATLYEVLTGRPPFTADDHTSVLRMILRDPPRRLRDLVPGIDAGLERVVMKALAKRREDRFASTSAMRDDLLAAASGAAVVAEPVPAPRTRGHGPGGRGTADAAASGPGWWAATEPATLHVHATPRAHVVVDGHPHGITPATLRVAPGPHAVRLWADGFAAIEERVEIAAGESRELHRELAPVDRARPDSGSGRQ